MLTNLFKTPFPYFGGKTDAAAAVWAALGDVAHYVEPFAGSLAVLLRRPHPANRPYFSETVNDSDGLLVNAWRSIQLSPLETADAAANPVAEADLHARHLALCRWAAERNLERLMGDPLWHDPVMGGWWLWGISAWIGGGWCSGNGAWVAGEGGRLAQRGESAREPGVDHQLPQLSDNGRGANVQTAREPGVDRQLPHLSDHGQGANRPGSREPGVKRQLPHLSAHGQGANRPGSREPGVENGNSPLDEDNPYHPVTMPEMIRWFRFLSARLRHVRILNGDWTRLVTAGASKTINVRMGDGKAGVFLDPPYGEKADRAGAMYADDCEQVAEQVMRWCAAHGEDKDYRIVLAGFDGEHNELEKIGWRSVEWFKTGFLKGGMAQLGGNGRHQQHRERIWISPHCLRAGDKRQSGFDFDQPPARATVVAN